MAVSRRGFVATAAAGVVALAAGAWRMIAGNSSAPSPTAGGTTAATTTTSTSSTTAPPTSLGTATTVPPTTATTSTVAETTTTTAAPETTTTTEATTTTEPPETTTTTEAPPETTTTTAAPVTESAVAITAICKDAWGAAPVAGDFVGHTIERLTVHHKASVLNSNTQAPAKARQHQKFHQDSGWPDVAYHFMVDAHGHVYEGRPTWAAGDTFTDYDPAGHFLVCGEGDFNQQALPQAQLEAMADVLAWAAVQFGVSPETIRGHRDYAATTCPGANLAPLIDDGTVRAMVEARIAAATPSLVIGCGQDTYDLVAAIESGAA